MSGWLALVRFDGGPLEPVLVASCMAQLMARGPHGEAMTLDGSAALGLTTLDTGESVPTARAPVRAGPLLVTGHARLDARDELGRLLGLAPTTLAELSDLALLACALERFGDDTPARVFGEYSAAAWDASRQHLLVVRDAFGVRQAYVSRVGPWAIASNTLDAVRAHPAVSERLDDEAILEFLLLDWVVGPGRTPFADVRLAPAGGSWSASAEGAHEATAWTLEAPDVDRRTPWPEQARRYQEALDRATADRLRGARASISLSGGIDSTSVAASAARQGVDPLYAMTEVMSAVREGRDEEGDWAALAARHLGICHEVFPIGVPPLDDPFASGPLLAPLLTCEPWNVPDTGGWAAMAAHGSVVLHGEGGDEIWRPTEMTGLLGVEPWGALVRGVVDTLKNGRRPPMGLNIRGRLRGTRRPIRPPAWLAPELAGRFDLEDLVRRGLALTAPRRRGPRAGSLKGLGSALWQGSNAEYDAQAAAQGVELRFPLLDPRVVHAALRLPPQPGVVGKLAARTALVGRLPDALVWRKKTPAAPIDERREMRPPWARLPPASQLAYYVDVVRLQADADERGTTWETLRAVSLWRWLAGGARRPGARPS